LKRKSGGMEELTWVYIKGLRKKKRRDGPLRMYELIHKLKQIKKKGSDFDGQGFWDITFSKKTQRERGGSEECLEKKEIALCRCSEVQQKPYSGSGEAGKETKEGKTHLNFREGTPYEDPSSGLRRRGNLKCHSTQSYQGIPIEEPMGYMKGGKKWAKENQSGAPITQGIKTNDPGLKTRPPRSCQSCQKGGKRCG